MKTPTPEGLSHPDAPLCHQSVILCVVHPITRVLRVPTKPGVQQIHLHLQHSPPLYGLAVPAAVVKKKEREGWDMWRGEPAKHTGLKHGSQSFTSTGHLVPMKLKKFLTLALISLMALPIMPPSMGYEL